LEDGLHFGFQAAFAVRVGVHLERAVSINRGSGFELSMLDFMV